MANYFDLTGKKAIIIGGAGGLGQLVARAYAEAGADVAIASRTESKLQAACEELKAEANQHVVDEKARLIYEDYVSILSPKEVRCVGPRVGGWGRLRAPDRGPCPAGEPGLPRAGGHQQEDAGAVGAHVR